MKRNRRQLEKVVMVMLMMFFLTQIYVMIDVVSFRYVCYLIISTYASIGITRYLTCRKKGESFFDIKEENENE